MTYDTQKNPFDGKWYVVKLGPRNRPIPVSDGYVSEGVAFNRMKAIENNRCRKVY